MIDKGCDAGAFCLQKPQCEYRCHLTNAVLEPGPRMVNLDEIEPASDMWQVIASIVVGFVLFAIALFAAAMFLTGAWIWSLLI